MTDFNTENNGFNDSEDDFEAYNEPDDESEDDYEAEYKVGYGKPPKHTQFRKGQSGNLKGRPKASKNPAEALAKELSKTIQFTENGEVKKVKAMDLIAKKIVYMAIQGNVSMLKKFMDSTIIDSYLFKDAMNQYNCTQKDRPKALTPELRLLVNKAKSLIQERYEKDMKKI